MILEANNEVDVLIVGARVAGSSLALLLGEMGKRVLLVDRDRFPSDTLSTHHIGNVQFLDRLGILADVEASGLRRLTRWRTHVGDCILEGPHGHYALVPRRNRLDQILIDHAVDNETVRFLDRTTAERLIVENDTVVGAVLRNASGEKSEVRARIVVGADGKYSAIASWVGAESYNEVPAIRCFFYAYYRNITPLFEPATELFLQHNRMGFLFPMEPGVDCLAMEMDLDEFEWFRKNPDQSFDSSFRRFYGMEKRMENAQLMEAVKGTRGIENYFRKPYGPGWVLTGDAAYCKDPSSGLGINDAFLQSFMLAEAFGKVFDGNDWDENMSEYHRKRDEAVMPLYKAILAFTSTPEIPPNTAALLKVLLGNPTIVASWAAQLPEMLRNSANLSNSVLMRAEIIAQMMFGYSKPQNES